jgi:hypothetical protein
VGGAEVPPSSDVSPGGRSTQGGAVGAECNCCGPAHRLDRPTTPGGKAGGQGWGGVTCSVLSRLDPLSPRWGEGWCWAGRTSRSMLPWHPKEGGARGGARVEGWTTSAHNKCWQGTA